MSCLHFVCAFCALSSLFPFVAAVPSDGVVFPDHRQSRSKGHKGGCGSTCPANSIPLSLAKELSGVATADQFLQRFVENGDDVLAKFGELESGLYFRGPFGQSGDTNRGPPVASCKPELRTVNLRDTNDPTVVYYPSCVRLEQCGGCCHHELLECQPTISSPVNVTIQMTKYTGTRSLKYLGKKTVTLVRHEQCACDCKTKSKDCLSSQVYKKDECRCVCVDQAEQKECAKQPEKLWNPSTCQCSCREMSECSTGYYFDQISCTCTRTVGWNNDYQPFIYRTKL